MSQLWRNEVQAARAENDSLTATVRASAMHEGTVLQQELAKQLQAQQVAERSLRAEVEGLKRAEARAALASAQELGRARDQEQALRSRMDGLTAESTKWRNQYYAELNEERSLAEVLRSSEYKDARSDEEPVPAQQMGPVPPLL